VTPVVSATPLLALHALRLTGMGDARSLARRFALDPEEVGELLLDFEAYGWVSRVRFADVRGWTLTESGRVENERQLAEELTASGARAVVARAHAAFLPLNARFQAACTHWQIRPLPGRPTAANDHLDFRWDDSVLRELATLGRLLAPLAEELAGRLSRFDGYAARYRAAIARVERGETSWIDGVGRDSCHAVWFELHEDLLATLGIPRGVESPLSPG
jgi:hypothetical protein